VVSSSRTQVLIDAGFSCRETERRMRCAGLDPQATDAILITHDHSDHIRGVERLSRVLRAPVYMTEATYQGWQRWAAEKKLADLLPRRERFAAGREFAVGDISVLSFTTPHDASDPVGFALRAEGVKLAVATDLGCVPANVAEAVRGCDLLMIESNHDLELLRTGPYPWPVKQRVMSRVGHLSNEALADFFLTQYDGAAAYVILAHLSAQNNHPEIARRAAEQALGARARGGLMLASQAEGLESVRL
jgi:phosphoribosyl 1,2-cyclic phosphodiesterase